MIPILQTSTVMARSLRHIRRNNYCTVSTGIFHTAKSFRLPSDPHPLSHIRTVSTLKHHAVPTWNRSSMTLPMNLPLLLPSLSIATLHNKPTNALQCINPPLYRTFAAKAANKIAKKDETNESTKTYWEQKKATKDRRRELFISREERKQRVKVRRAGKPQDTKKIEFQEFYIQKKVTDEYLDRKARQAKLDWKIRVAVLLERLNVVQPDKEPWEVEYEELKMHLNRFGKQYPKEFAGGDFNYDQKRPMTYDALLAELPFTPAPRETEADLSGDVRTTNRKLKTRIYLTVQEHKDGLWQLPTVDMTDGDETLLDAAKRAIPERVGTDLEFWCPSNCPWSVHLSTYNEEEQKLHQLYGSKTFVMKVQYDDGDVILDMKQKNGLIHDFAWLDRQEMTDRVKEQQGDHMSKFYYYML